MAVSRERVVKSAEKYVSRGKIEPAIKEYRKLLAENPNDISTLNRVGDLYARIHRNSEAIDLFTQIAKQYAEDGFFVKSIAIYKKIIKIDPTLLEVYEQLADLYHRQGLVNEARTQYQVLADYYLKHDRTGQAIGIYRRMADLEPEDPSHHVKLAELYQQQGQTLEAMGEYRAIADLMLEHGKGIEAARVYERALDIDSGDLGFVTDAVLKLKEGGHVAAAANFLALAVERNPQAERVAKIAGLESRPAAESAEPVAAEADEPEASTEPGAGEPWEPPPADDPSTVDMAEAIAEAESVSAQEGPGAFEVEALEEPEVFEFDLDDHTSASLVTPPADMLEDEGRRGAAWGESEPRAAAPEPETAAEAEDEIPHPASEPLETATGTFEIGLDDLEMEVEADEPELDHDLLERTAAEVHAPRGDGDEEVEDLLTEAEVLARYGIEEKALDRLAELLQREPYNLEGYALMVGIHLDAGRHERVVAVSGRLAEIAAETGDETVWPDLRERMEESGYQVHGEGGAVRIEAPQGAEAPVEAPVEEAAAFSAPESEALADADGAPDEDALAPIDEEDLEIDLDGDLLVGSLDDAPAEAVEVAAESIPGPPAEDLPPVDEPEPIDAPPPARPPDRAPEPEAPPVEEPPAEDEPVEEPPPETPPVQEPAKKKQDVDSILAQLSGQFLGRRKKRAPAEAEPEPVEAPAAASAEPIEPIEPAPPADAPGPAPDRAMPPAAAASATPATGAGVDPLRALGDSLRAEIDEPTAAASAVAPVSAQAPAAGTPPTAAESAGPPTLEDTGVSWLDEVADQPPADDDAFSDDDFFDLGAELEEELSKEEGMDEELVVMEAGDQSLEEIVEGFKRGVAENLSPEDFDTHYNLGIAYREMGLLDEAIGEFQLAAREPAYLVSCASMLGLCFNEKGLPELAVKWYRRGLDAPDVSDEDRSGLLYDLGEAQVAAGDRMSAYHTFVDLYGINTNYRDVVARLAELEPVG